LKAILATNKADHMLLNRYGGGKTHTEIVQLLVDAGSSVNIPDKNGISPLQHAKKRGYKNIVSILEKAGAK
ncbi:MAG: ankyrin repeat domain-containing protein, partial [Ferruginibacter sp.]